jgi:hypothetical protein
VVGLITWALGALGRKVVLFGALVLAGVMALGLIWRSGRAAGRRELAIRQSAARIQTHKTALEIRHEITQTPVPDQRRRLGRWMRD